MNFAHVNHQENRRLFSTPAGFGADEPQRLQARVWPCNGIAGETANFDVFRDDRTKPKWPKSSEQHPHQRVNSRIVKSESALLASSVAAEFMGIMSGSLQRSSQAEKAEIEAETSPLTIQFEGH
eukprot:scaffold13946_cov60-Cyclotella_meneghiniana.AAC.2